MSPRARCSSFPPPVLFGKSDAITLTALLLIRADWRFHFGAAFMPQNVAFRGELDWAGEHVNVVESKANGAVVAELHTKVRHSLDQTQTFTILADVRWSCVGKLSLSASACPDRA